VTSAGEADYYVVPLRATPYSHPNELSIFVVEGSDANIAVVGRWDGMGLRGNSSTPVHFNGRRAPASHRLGASGYGFPMLMAYALPIFQVGLAAVYLGIAQAAFEAALLHAASRVHTDTGEPLAKVETIQRYVAEMKTRIDQTRLVTYRAAQRIDEFRATDLLSAIEDDDFLLTMAEAKLAACEAAIAVTNTALQVCGGTGYKRGHPVERCYRDARAGSVMGPNDDALKVLIGQRLLGLPFPWE
jgi:alkylation response protein AidB-like acyl-CoA dehydrogenase